MPNFNQTGPQGQGPMTGRGMGRCTGNVPANDSQNDQKKQSSSRTADARLGASDVRPGEPLGMGMARRRGFGAGRRAGRGSGRGRW